MLITTHKTMETRFFRQGPLTKKVTFSFQEYCDSILYDEPGAIKINTMFFWNNFKFTKEEFKKARALMKKKNHDYAGVEDPFSNFRMCQNLNLCTTLTGMLVRLCDKMSRFENLAIKKLEQKVKDESIEDTRIDIINYGVLIIEFILTEG